MWINSSLNNKTMLYYLVNQSIYNTSSILKLIIILFK